MPSPGSASHLRQAGVEGTRMGVTFFPPSQNDKGGQTGPHFAEPGTGYFTQEVPHHRHLLSRPGRWVLLPPVLMLWGWHAGPTAWPWGPLPPSQLRTLQ